MYKRLIDEEWESYNDAGLRFANEINAIVEPVIDKFIAEGYSIFDMDKIAYDQIALMMIYKLADRNINRSFTIQTNLFREKTKRNPGI